ncbi:ABC transporter substrate-binding protein [Massilia sp. CF038]|uniref:substrate-binding periplasmic protein n=1 Tax=Massilia sp. CF038 TaxID=1881045 RepID=UPI000920699A|nr:transporter substrate-binding domain-containing protein [Massilia sp. CF038]SHH67369.1 amino acid ABC transporter substrate-binding protein, PAAT family [Massilia sp. CF038]
MFRTWWFGICLALASVGVRAEDITLTNGEWLPFQSEKLAGYGVLSRVVTEAFALEGVTVHYLFRPWPRAMAEAQDGPAQGSIVWSKGKPGSARNRNFIYSDVVFEGKAVFFQRTGFPFAWKTYADLAKFRIGGVAGYEYDFEGTPGVRIDRAPSEQLSMRKLLAGRFDVYPTIREVGWYTLHTQFSAAEAAAISEYRGRPYNQPRYHLILPRRLAASPRRLAQFNQGLRRLRESGRYDQLMAELAAGRY